MFMKNTKEKKGTKRLTKHRKNFALNHLHLDQLPSQTSSETRPSNQKLSKKNGKAKKPKKPTKKEKSDQKASWTKC